MFGATVYLPGYAYYIYAIEFERYDPVLSIERVRYVRAGTVQARPVDIALTRNRTISHTGDMVHWSHPRIKRYVDMGFTIQPV